MNVLVTYNSYSGNTEEVAEIIVKSLKGLGIRVYLHRMEYDEPIYSVEEYDLVFLGTFTWDQGSTPEEVKDFILDLGYKPKNIAVFGTGDTQFGGDLLFCRAVDKLKKFFGSNYDVLKIEQSPRGSQEDLVVEWVNNIIKENRKNIRDVI